MSLLEYYVKEFITIEDYIVKEFTSSDIKFKKVKMLVNHHGVTEIREVVFDEEEFNLVKKHGYYLR